MQDGIYNAKISLVSICDNDHGSYNVFVEVDYGHSRQGIGNYGLAPIRLKNDKITDHWKLGYMIVRLMEVCDVTNFSKVQNSYVRVKVTNGLISEIGNILKDDLWFNPIKEMWHEQAI
jgi:hypothetical protein